MSCDQATRRPRPGRQRRQPIRRRAVTSYKVAASAQCRGRSIRSDSRRGFSLVELMVVIVIIGLLAGVVTVSVRSYLIRSKQNVARLEIAKICQALDTFYGEFDRYPTNEEGIEALVENSDAFPDGLLNKLPRDPWGQPYEYHSPGSNGPYEVICYGADRQEGGTGADFDMSSADLDEDKS